MKLKLFIFAIAISISFTGCTNNMQNNRMSSTTEGNIVTTTPVVTELPTVPLQTEQIVTPKVTANYSSFTGNWICKDKKTSMDIKVDTSGNVEGSITTVVSSHVPSSLIMGTIKNDILVAKLKVGEGQHIKDIGTLTLAFNNPQILKGNVKLDITDVELAQGEMVFEKYYIASNEKGAEHETSSTVVVNENSKIQNDLVYTNTKMGFTLSFPETWEGKYLIEENEKSATVIYNTVEAKEKNIYFFGITFTDKTKWIDNDNSGIPTKKICEKNGLVYYVFFPTQAGFDRSSENEKKEADEFLRLNQDTENIIKSFRLAN